MVETACKPTWTRVPRARHAARVLHQSPTLRRPRAAGVRRVANAPLAAAAAHGRATACALQPNGSRTAAMRQNLRWRSLLRSLVCFLKRVTLHLLLGVAGSRAAVLRSRGLLETQALLAHTLAALAYPHRQFRIREAFPGPCRRVLQRPAQFVCWHSQAVARKTLLSLLCFGSMGAPGRDIAGCPVRSAPAVNPCAVAAPQHVRCSA